MRNGRPLAEGWTIVDRGPVESKPAPRRWKLEDFHVGDTIRLKADHWAVKHEGVPEGTTTKLVEREQGGHFRTDLKPCADKEYAMRFTPIEYTEAQVEKVEPAPQPKDEDFDPPITPLNKPTLRVPAYKAELDTARQEIASLQSEVTSLKAEVNNARSEQERLDHSLADARSEMTENYRQYRKAQDRADAAEAKLADIKAIMRTAVIMRDAKVSTHADAMQSVLDR